MQRVVLLLVVENSQSSTSHVTSGVPRGYILCITKLYSVPSPYSFQPIAVSCKNYV